MEKDKILLDGLSSSTQDEYVPGVTVSCVTFCFYLGSLKLLLCKPEGQDNWVLPGGSIIVNEDADDAMRRVLKSTIGVKSPYLKQLCFFANKKRTSINEADEDTVSTRLINLAYYSFVKNEDVKQPRMNPPVHMRIIAK